MTINLNTVAKEVSIMEDGKEEISIAQIKEVIKEYNIILMRDYTPSEILKMLEKYECST